jgi:signal peptidase I
MEPTFSNNNILCFSKNVEQINEQDIIVAHVGNETLVKRITGVPGEIYYMDTNIPVSYMMSSSLFDQKDEWLAKMKINKMVIPKGYFFIEGDAQQSVDSKSFGLVKKDDIFGKYISKL